MCTNAIFFNGNEALAVANDGAELQYYAHLESLPPGYEAIARSSEDRELLFYVQSGTVEFMVDGAATFVSDGQVVRIQRNRYFAYRNPDGRPARLLVRSARPCENKAMMRVTCESAA